MRYSLVIPTHNEADNLPALLAEIAALPATRAPAEAIVVDDASSDATAKRITELMATYPWLRLVRLPVRAGQSAAILAGMRAARSEWVATMDGDGENDPLDLPRLVDLAETTGADLIGGLRRRRQASLSKRLASRVANGLRRAVLEDGCADTGCGLKLLRRDVFLELPAFNGMHRFLPALFRIADRGTRFIEVNDRLRRHGRSHYGNLDRAIRGIADLLGVWWLKRRSIAGAARAAKEETGS